MTRAGLWESEVRLSSIDTIDFTVVYSISKEQSVVGLVAAGLEHVSDVLVPKEVVLMFIGDALQLEQRNIAMNYFIGELVDKMRTASIYSLLLKGQGVAQCYIRPLWRTSGDVDFFLSDSNYKRAFQLLAPNAKTIDEENKYNLHISMFIPPCEVELHGSLRGGLWHRIESVLDDIKDDVFYKGNVRSWINDKTQVFLLRADEDVVYVFTHILQHFFQEGVGLRQVCDWIRLLWVYHSTLDYALLETRLRSMGILSEWRSFAAMAVDFLDVPKDVIPFYSSDRKWSRKGERIISFILKTGNFGGKRNHKYYKRVPFILSKLISFGRHTRDAFYYSRIFPIDSIRVWLLMFSSGLKRLV